MASIFSLLISFWLSRHISIPFYPIFIARGSPSNPFLPLWLSYFHHTYHTPYQFTQPPSLFAISIPTYGCPQPPYDIQHQAYNTLGNTIRHPAFNIHRRPSNINRTNTFWHHRTDSANTIRIFGITLQILATPYEHILAPPYGLLALLYIPIRSLCI